MSPKKRFSNLLPLFKKVSVNHTKAQLNQNNYCVNILPFNLNNWHLFYYFLVILICFLFFNQGDLNHTVRSSYAFLNGHITDFYEYNKLVVGANNYLPVVYIVFAIWNLPIHILGLTSDLSNGPLFLNQIEIAWSKLLLALFFAGTIYFLNKCAKLLSPNQDKIISLYSALFATSPIALFAVFIFSQYDIIGSFFTILAFYYYLKKDLTSFAWFFSIAIGFKFFAIIIYLPLVLLAEKKILPITKLYIIGALITFSQFLFYWNSQAFYVGVLSIPTGKAEGLSLQKNILFNSNTYYLFAYLLICIFAYIYKTKDSADYKKYAIFISIISYSLMFSSVVWHPQWLIIIMPFFCLSYYYINNHKIFYILDTVGMFSFTWICVNKFPNNVDASMLSGGIFGSLFQIIPLTISDLMPPQFLPVFIILFKLYLFSPLLLLTTETIFKFIAKADNSKTYFYYVRFVLGISFFVLPSFFCAYIPTSLAVKINRESYLQLYKYKKGLSLDESIAPAGEITRDILLTQKIKAEDNGLCAISLFFATYQRKNASTIKINLEDINKRNIYTTFIDGSLLKDNYYYTIYFPVIKNSKGKDYFLKISSINGTNGKSVTIWKTKQPYKDGFLLINDTKADGNICMRLYYHKD